MPIMKDFMASTCRKDPGECYKWLVVLCSFVNHMATTGFIMSLSVMYVSWLEEFGEGNGKTSWILSLDFALHIGFSPITASLASKFGFRSVAFVGGLVTAFGLAISALATSVLCLIVTIGLVSGIGCSFCFLPPYALISLLFDNRRSLAIGIATTGVGVGAFAFSPLIALLVDTYSWRGALLILSAISLNMCVTGLLLKPIQNVETDTSEEESIPTINNGNDEGQEKWFEPNVLSHERSKFFELNDDKDGSALRCYENSEKVPTSNAPLTISATNTQSDEHNHEQVITNYDLRSKTPISPFLSLPNLAQQQIKKRFFQSSFNYLHNADTILLASVNGFCAASTESMIPSKKLNLQNLDAELNKPTTCKSNAYENRKSLLHGPLSLLAGMTRLKVFQDKMFFLFCVSNLLTNISLLAPVMYLVDRANHHGIDSSVGAIIISANGVGNILGRLLTGLVASDGCCSNRTFLYVVGMCANGLGTVLSPMCGSRPVLHGIYATYFGFHIGAYMVLMPMVTVELNGVANLASVIGQVLAFHGIGILIGPPIAGWLFDWTRSYTTSYVVNGAFLIVSGLMLLPLLWTAKKTQHPDGT